LATEHPATLLPALLSEARQRIGRNSLARVHLTHFDQVSFHAWTDDHGIAPDLGGRA